VNGAVAPLGVPFPSIPAQDLEGKTLTIPKDLPVTSNLVALAFSREHLGPMETWSPHFSHLERDFPGLGVWQVAALSKVYRMFRSAIDGGMRAGVADARMRAHVLTAYLDLPSLQRALALPDLRDIHLYLLDGLGTIRWHESGDWTADRVARLLKALESLQV
jgi:hypothetical protein